MPECIDSEKLKRILQEHRDVVRDLYGTNGDSGLKSRLNTLEELHHEMVGIYKSSQMWLRVIALIGGGMLAVVMTPGVGIYWRYADRFEEMQHTIVRMLERDEARDKKIDRIEQQTSPTIRRQPQ